MEVKNNKEQSPANKGKQKKTAMAYCLVVLGFFLPAQNEATYTIKFGKNGSFWMLH